MITVESLMFEIDQLISDTKSVRDRTQEMMIKCMKFALENTNEQGLGDMRPLNHLFKAIQSSRYVNMHGAIQWVLLAAGGKHIPSANPSEPDQVDTSNAVLKWKKDKFIFRSMLIEGQEKRQKFPLSPACVKSLFPVKFWMLNAEEQQPYKPKDLNKKLESLLKWANNPKKGDNVPEALLNGLMQVASENGIFIQ